MFSIEFVSNRGFLSARNLKFLSAMTRLFMRLSLLMFIQFANFIKLTKKSLNPITKFDSFAREKNVKSKTPLRLFENICIVGR